MKQTVDWNDDQIATLTRMWAAGAPTSEIGDALGGATRSTIVGKVYRLGLPKRRASITKSNAYLVNKQRQSNRTPAKLQQAPMKIELNPSDVARIFRTEDLKFCSCRWPIGDPLKEGFGYCGARAEKPFGYCAEHHARGTLPTPKLKFDKRLR